MRVPVSRRSLAVAVALAVVVGALPGGKPRPVAAAAPTSQWYAADLHVHSAVSADARPDLPLLAQNARAAGLNAVFLTDHNQASDFEISARTANNAFFDVPTHDDINHWTKAGSGVSQVSSPVHSGSASTRLASTGANEQYLTTVRGPNFRVGTGAVTTTFSVYPTALGTGSTLYVSASIGGDVTVESSAPGPPGYTPQQSGVPAPCKSVVFVWYFGSAPDASRYQPTSAVCNKASPIPTAIVKLFPITAAQCDKAFTMNTWNTCTLDIDAAMATLSAADMPLDYLGIEDLKVAAKGTVTAYVDDYSTRKTVPAGSTVDTRAGAEFAARNALIPQFDDPAGNFRVFPSLEEGTGEHAQRFNFGITNAGQYTTDCNGSCNYPKGTSGIAPTQLSGYPAQLNHPGVSGGVSDSAATGVCSNGLTPACGADVMEVRKRNMSNDWDTILKTGTPLVGSWGSDNHIGSWSGSSLTTFLYARSNSFDDLMQALYEGRAYDAKLGTSAARIRILLALGSSSEPYPARYPLYLPTGDSVDLHATVTSVKAGTYVRWVQNGAMGANLAPTSGTTFDGHRTLALSGSSVYARVEVGTSGTSDADGTSQAIILKPAATGLPSGMSYHVERVTPPAGQPAFTKGMTRGITASSWNGSAQALSLTLTDRVGSLAEVRVASSTGPTSMTADGTTVSQATSMAAFDASTGPAWFYDGQTAYLKAIAEAGSDTMVVLFGTSGGDVTPPTIPGTPVATSIGTTTATVAWTRSSDDVGVVRYDVRRDGSVIGSAPQPSSGDPSFADSGLSPATTYTYTVTAVDAAGNSTASGPGTVTTLPGAGGTTTVNPIADAKVDSSTPGTNFATSALRVDGSPDVRSYLKFDTSAIAGNVQSATLRVWATSAQVVGYDVYAVGDSSWTETGITYANRPSGSVSPTKLGSSGPVASGTWTTVDVTAAFAAAGVGSLELRTTSATALALSSREDPVHPPQLVVATN